MQKPMKLKNGTFLVIPAYNEEKVIGKVLDKLLFNGWKNIIVVNDGSRDNTEKEVSKRNVHLFSHSVNRGLGGALGTGIKAAIGLNAKIIVTFDADGQHDHNDLYKVIEPIYSGKCDVVIGSRLINSHGMPWYRICMNKVANLITYFLFQIWTTDSQSGLRAFSFSAAKLLDLQTNKMEVSSEILHKIKKNNLHLKEIPIKAIYTGYSLSKGQNLFEGMKTLIKLVIYKLA